MESLLANLSEEQRLELIKALQLKTQPQKFITIPAPPPLAVGRTKEELKEWLADMKRHVDSQGFSKEDPNMIYLYEQNFAPELQLQWKTFQRATRTSGEEKNFTLEELQQWLPRFCLPDPKLEDHIRALIRTKQGKQSVAEYIPRFNEAITRLPALTTELVVAFFKVGLNEDISQELHEEDPVDLQAATAAALRVERQVARTNVRGELSKEGTLRSAYPKEGRLRCSFCQRFGHDVSSCRKFLANQPMVGGAPPAQPPPPPPVPSGRASRPLNF